MLWKHVLMVKPEAWKVKVGMARQIRHNAEKGRRGTRFPPEFKKLLEEKYNIACRWVDGWIWYLCWLQH